MLWNPHEPPAAFMMIALPTSKLKLIVLEVVASTVKDPSDVSRIRIVEASTLHKSPSEAGLILQSVIAVPSLTIKVNRSSD